MQHICFSTRQNVVGSDGRRVRMDNGLDHGREEWFSSRIRPGPED
jgi:hypothetical protein